jgi:glycerol-3-phosphate acyltransferase PlsY
MSFLTLSLITIVFYFIGSFPTGYLIVKFLYQKDVRTIGSKSTGATNVLRAGSKMSALATLVVDFLKVYAPLWIASFLLNPTSDTPVDVLMCYYLLFGSAGVLGHMYSPMLRFDGGKGIASMLGLFFWVNPSAAFLALFVFVILVFATKIVSVATLSALTIGTAYLLRHFIADILSDRTVTDSLLYSSLFLFSVTVSLIIWRHRSNILRLLKGTENKISKL